MKESEAAVALSVTVAALRRWRRELRGPKWYKIGGKSIRYEREDLEAFVRESVCGAPAGGRRIASVSR